MTLSIWFQVLIPIVSGGIGWLVGWKLKERSESLRLAREGIRQKRMDAYAEVLKPVLAIFTGVGKQSSESPKPDTKAWREKHFDLMFFGDDSVIRLWNDFWQKQYSSKVRSPEEVKEIVLDISRIILEVRRSVGHPNTGLSETDMLAWFLRDIDTLIEVKKSTDVRGRR